MKRNRIMLAATAVGAMLFLLTLGASRASADTFDFTSCHITGRCPSTDFGTATLTQSGPSVNFDVVLINGNRFPQARAGGNSPFLFNERLSASPTPTIS